MCVKTTRVLYRVCVTCREGIVGVCQNNTCVIQSVCHMSGRENGCVSKQHVCYTECVSHVRRREDACENDTCDIKRVTTTYIYISLQKVDMMLC